MNKLNIHTSKQISSFLVAFFGIILTANLYAETETAVEETKEIVLQNIEVIGIQTESSDAYNTNITNIGGKGPAEIRDIPLTVTVMSRQFLDDLDLTTIEEAFDYNPVVTVATGDLFGGSIYARGREIFLYLADGLSRPLQSIYGTAPDLTFYDRIEVLSGPWALSNGAGEPGGIINLARKRAHYDFDASASSSIGSYNSYRGDIDVTGSITEDGSMRGRLVAFGSSEDSFVDVTGSKNQGEYATLEYDLSDSSTIAFGALIEHQDTIRFSGLPTLADGTLIDFDRSTFIGADWNSFDNRSVEVFVDYENKFSNGSELRVSARRYNLNAEMEYVLPSSSVNAAGNFSILGFARDFDEDSRTIDVNIKVPFSFSSLKNSLTIGADYAHSIQETKQRFNGLGTQNINALTTNITQPAVVFPCAAGGPNFCRNQDIRIPAVYSKLETELFNSLTASVGARIFDYRSDVLNVGTGITTKVKEEGEIVPFAGVTYDFNDMWTAYFSYTDINQPQSALTATGDPIGLRSGDQIEAGLKGRFLQDRLSAQLSIYQLEDENRAISTGGFNNIGSDELKTQGMEAQVSGEVLPGLDVILAYAYADHDFSGAGTGANNFGLLTSEHSFSSWAKYTFQAGAVKGLSVGAGVRSVSAFKSIVSGIEIKADGYSVVDMRLGYKVNEHFDASLVVNNVLDENYIQRVNEVSRGTFYGEPLAATFKVSLTY